MKALYVLVSLFFLSALTLAAERVESTAGTLKNLIPNPDITSLTITGSINAADLDFINNHLTYLTTLDISGTAIEAYSGDALTAGITSSAANTLPAYSLIGSPVATLTLPSGLRAMGEGCLAASSITSITIPDGVNDIDTGAFDGCTSLVSVTLPASIKAIAPLAFKGCTALPAITLPDGVESIGSQAFKGCTALTQATLPSSLHTIAAEAFSNCPNLTDVNFPATLESIGADAFNGTAIENLDLSGCTRLKTTGNWAFGHCAALTTVTLPASLSTVGDGLFFDCSELETVTMPATLTSLTPYMFKGTALTTADGIITATTSKIDRYALYGNDRITVVKLPAALTSLGDKAMASMTSLKTLDAADLTELPTLGTDVFANTAGSNVTLLASEEMAPVFEATPQWQEFNIKIDTGAGIPTVDAPEDNGLQLMYDGNALHIKSTRPLASVSLYDTRGIATARITVPGDNEASISTNNVAHGVVIVLLQFTDNTHATFKTKI